MLTQSKKRSGMKINRLQRILQLVSTLQSQRHYGPDQLAQKMDVDRRTIFRDLKTLKLAGVPYYFDEEKNGYKISENFMLPPMRLDFEESLSLLLLGSYYNKYTSVPLSKQAQRAITKIENNMPRHIQQYCIEIIKNTSMRSPRKSINAQNEQDVLLKLQQAIRRRRKVKIVYDSFHEKRNISTTISPYHLHFSRFNWYVIAHSSMHKETRTFKLQRIEDITVLIKRYVSDKPFDLDEYLSLAWSIIPEGKIYDIKLRFSQMVARNVAETLWHRTQKLSWLKDGKLIFEAKIDGLGEISWWILRYGDQVEVLEPKLLKQRISRVAKKIVKIYK